MTSLTGVKSTLDRSAAVNLLLNDDQEFLGFKDRCSAERVGRSWRKYHETRIAPLDALLMQELGQDRPLGKIEVILSHEGLSRDIVPPRLVNGKDLKRRFIKLREFSLDVVKLFKDDLTKLVLLSRLTEFRTIKERSWMGLYNIHVPIMEEISLALTQPAKQKKICLALEGSNYTKLTASRGYFVGSEERLTKVLSMSLLTMQYLPRWLAFRSKPNLQERTARLEAMHSDNLDMPYCFVTPHMLQEIREILSPSACYIPLVIEESV